MRWLLRYLDRFFNRLYSSEYNPLYRSGTIAVGLFAFVFITGIYLAFFYRLGTPYESVLSIQKSPLFIGWIRSLHRYASDILVVVVILHVARMFAQRKNWGPRSLAWISGVGLFAMMLFSGWTGFLMVWDAQAQAVAEGGARIIDSLKFFSDPISQSFSGISDPPASFFFLILFLHVVIPLGMVFGLWIHTSKIARSIWFPKKKLLIGLGVVLTFVSVIWPAPLAEKANLLARTGSFPNDWFYNFWLPGVEDSPRLIFFIFTAGLILLSAVPWIFKPKGQQRPKPAFNDPKICQSCSQCVSDCPYEAIQMVDMIVSGAPKNVAQVNPNLCVGCGLCSASCAPFTMGPVGRKAGHQMTAAKHFLTEARSDTNPKTGRTLLIGCQTQLGSHSRLEKFCRNNSDFDYHSVQCAGTLHISVIETLARSYSSVVIASCPERNCHNKDGVLLLTERLSGVREPTFMQKEIRARVKVFPVGDGEEFRLFQFLRKGSIEKFRASWVQRLPAILASFILLFLVAGTTRIHAPAPNESPLLRMSLRLSGQSEKKCRVPTPEEVKKTLSHMQAQEICTYRSLSYNLRAQLDQQLIVDIQLDPGGMRNDRPLYFHKDFSVPTGRHLIRVNLNPVDEGQTSNVALSFEKFVHFQPGRVILLYLSADQKEILIKGDLNE